MRVVLLPGFASLNGSTFAASLGSLIELMGILVEFADLAGSGY